MKTEQQLRDEVIAARVVLYQAELALLELSAQASQPCEMEAAFGLVDAELKVLGEPCEPFVSDPRAIPPTQRKLPTFIKPLAAWKHDVVAALVNRVAGYKEGFKDAQEEAQKAEFDMLTTMAESYEKATRGF